MSFCLASTHRVLLQVPKCNLRYFSTNPNKFLILNALGIDRPGIVSDVTKIVTDVGGNVGESRAVKLGNHFSIMMLLTVPESNALTFGDSLKSLKDITTNVIETSNPGIIAATPKIVFIGDLTLSGGDHPGIVHKVTSLIARTGLSVDEIETSQEEAPYGGTTLFHMKGKVTVTEPVASNFDLESLQNDLTNLGNSLNCDISLEEASEEKGGVSSM